METVYHSDIASKDFFLIFSQLPGEGSCEKIENRFLPALSVRRSARSTQVERALRAPSDVDSGPRPIQVVTIQVFTTSGDNGLTRDRVGVVVPQVHALRGQRPGLF